jgi:hypothetical protein
LDQITELEQRIRQYYNDRPLRDLVPAAAQAKQSQVAAALDTLQASTFALTYFHHRGIPDSNRTSPVRIGAMYLHLYGTLQAAYMQQDAISDLWRLLVGCKAPIDSLAGWRALREWRDIVSHPQRSGPLISEMSIRKKGFDVWLHKNPSKLPRRKTVDLLALLRAHEKDATTLLRQLELKLRAKWK